MLIDWFTVIAQVINFLILVFLLHRFLYRPITKTIQARQKEIQRRWQEAEEEKSRRSRSRPLRATTTRVRATTPSNYRRIQRARRARVSRSPRTSPSRSRAKASSLVRSDRPTARAIF